MKLEFEKPTITVIDHIGPLTNDEIAALPDGELEEYLRKHGYFDTERRKDEV